MLWPVRRDVRALSTVSESLLPSAAYYPQVVLNKLQLFFAWCDWPQAIAAKRRQNAAPGVSPGLAFPLQ